jgi:predicted anti-sigma-YlaC factor YlaD
MSIIKRIQNLFRPVLTCEQANRFIVEYLEGELPTETEKKFEGHLDKCPCCTPFLEQYRQTIQLVHEDGQMEVPADLIEHTITFLREQMDNP